MMNELSDTDDPNGDGEGVWSPDIEYYFHEALELFPQCGRRKTILQEEGGGGKMYGRNELIARHILIKTGKVRTRKQVSSHIQVLARRKAKSEATSNGGGSTAGSVSPASSMDVAGDVCGAGGNGNGVVVGGPRNGRLDSTTSLDSGTVQLQHQHQHQLVQNQQQQRQPRPPIAATNGCFYDVWNDRSVVTQKIRLVEFSAFIEHIQTTTATAAAAATITTSNPSPAFTSQQLAPPNPLGGLTSLASAALASSAPVGLSQAHTTPNQMTQLADPANHVASVNVMDTSPVTLAHPLASNHHLPAQFNQATNYQHQSVHGHLLNNTNNNNQFHISHHNQGTGFLATSMPINLNGRQLLSNQQPQPQNSTGLTRHSYVKIDYRQLLNAHASKLERIDISQIQDKFPEIGGTEGLFQRSCSDAFFLVKFWADLNNDFEYNIEDQNSYFGFSSHFETIERYENIICSTKACSYGHQVVEKVDKIHSTFNRLNGRYSYEMNRSPMCEFMIQFIKKLRQLPRATQMNSVLENFTVLQVVTNESTSEILICLAYVFEIAAPEQNRGGSQYHVYKLTRD